MDKEMNIRVKPHPWSKMGSGSFEGTETGGVNDRGWTGFLSSTYWHMYSCRTLRRREF